MPMIDFENEDLLTLAQATKAIPGRPSISTLYRWTQRGIEGVKLETIKLGGKRFTSKEAIRRFVERTTAPANENIIVDQSVMRSHVDDVLDAYGL